MYSRLCRSGSENRPICCACCYGHHYQGQRIPALLMEHLIQLLRRREDLDDWPLETILPDREAFFAFPAGNAGPFFWTVAAKQQGLRVSDIADRYGLELPGPSDLPFDHDDIRIYVDNLFQEGFLQAVPHENAGSLSGTWLSFGIRIRPSGRPDAPRGRPLRITG